MTTRCGTQRKAQALYDLLEHQVIPEFYARNGDGIPTAWVARMRKSMATLTPQFSADRAVREYTEQHYLPAAKAYRERAANQGALGPRNCRMAARSRQRVGGECGLARSERRLARASIPSKWTSSSTASTRPLSAWSCTPMVRRPNAMRCSESVRTPTVRRCRLRDG